MVTCIMYTNNHTTADIEYVTHSSVVSDGATDDGIVHNGCQHISRVCPPAQYGRSQERLSEYILTYKPRWDLSCLGVEWETCY